MGDLLPMVSRTPSRRRYHWWETPLRWSRQTASPVDQVQWGDSITNGSRWEGRWCVAACAVPACPDYATACRLAQLVLRSAWCIPPNTNWCSRLSCWRRRDRCPGRIGVLASPTPAARLPRQRLDRRQLYYARCAIVVWPLVRS